MRVHDDFKSSTSPRRVHIHGGIASIPSASIVVCLPEMDAYRRPNGLTETAVFMSLTNALGWFIVDWSRPHAATTFWLFTIFILIS